MVTKRLPYDISGLPYDINMGDPRPQCTFAWVRAFPTVFPPEYIDSKWIIRHDITGSVSIRDRNVKKKKKWNI